MLDGCDAQWCNYQNVWLTGPGVNPWVQLIGEYMPEEEEVPFGDQKAVLLRLLDTPFFVPNQMDT